MNFELAFILYIYIPLWHFAEKKLLIHVLDNLLDPSDLCKSHMKSNEITHVTYTNVILPCSVAKI